MSLRPEPADRQYFPINFSINGTPQTIYPTTCNPFYYINWVNYFEFKNSITPLPKPTPPNGLWSYYYLSNIADNASTASVSINIEPELSIRRNVYVYVYSPAGYAGETTDYSSDGDYSLNGAGGGGGSGFVYSLTLPKKTTIEPVSIKYATAGSSGEGVYISYEQNKIAITDFIPCGLNGDNGTNGSNQNGSETSAGNGGNGGNGGCGGGGGVGGWNSESANGTPQPFGTNGSSGAYEQTTTSNITTNDENYDNSNGNTYEVYGGYMNVTFADGLKCEEMITSGYGGSSNSVYGVPPPNGTTSNNATWEATSGYPLTGFILVMYEI